MKNSNKLETTLGDLIVALTDEAACVAPNEREAYKLVALALSNLNCSACSGAGNLSMIY